MPDVSIHIVTFNSADTLEGCIAHALAQRDVDSRILVVDNGSSDGTAQLADSLGVDVLRNAENRGYGAAHNQAIEATDSRYVLTLNPDVWLEPDFLRHMVRALDDDPRAGSAAGCLLRVDHLGDTPRFVDSAGLYMRSSRRQGLRAEGVPVAERPTEPGLIFGPDGAAAVYRRAMLDDVRIDGEIFDGDFFIHKEDVDLCWRALWRGWHSRYVPDALAQHVRRFRPGKRWRVDDALRYYALRNRYFLLLKNDSAAMFWKDFPAIAFYEVCIAAYLLAFERKSLRVYSALWKQRAQMSEKRRLIQQRRAVAWQAVRQWF